MYICVGTSVLATKHQEEGSFGTGPTLLDAYNGWKEHTGDNDPPDDCVFYRLGERVEVEVKIVEKTVIQVKGNSK